LTVNVWVLGFIGCEGFDMGVGDSFNVFLLTSKKKLLRGILNVLPINRRQPRGTTLSLRINFVDKETPTRLCGTEVGVSFYLEMTETTKTKNSISYLKSVRIIGGVCFAGL